ncbi:tyrosinase MelC2 [Streptomyces sp. SCSIO ZS0520]|uniref:tyrosinase MelC2 n=1 Tax=Streptomyces sp. SCSIO ZS0520 TaxID=2892996 RepID=UPI0021DA77C2|nr:tyrosinase family protein [Streptomyces sp. SCSIO ZS0520]
MRKNQATLTDAEKQDFVEAVLALKRRGRYDRFVRTHQEFVMSDTDDGPRVAHRGPSFLPWHRRFLLDFEEELRGIDDAVELPYWDWTVDQDPEAAPWTEDFLGGTGRAADGQVTTGPFARGGGRWRISVRVDSRDFLRRSLGAGGVRLPTRAELDSVLALSTYDQSPWHSRADGFRNQLEGWRGVDLHNRIHQWVDGHMATGASPNDPVFWLHHCFIDKLWADWQRLHPGSGYLPRRPTRDVVSLEEPMRPWGDVTPADMLDHTRFYAYDTDEEEGEGAGVETETGAEGDPGA